MTRAYVESLKRRPVSGWCACLLADLVHETHVCCVAVNVWLTNQVDMFGRACGLWSPIDGAVFNFYMTAVGVVMVDLLQVRLCRVMSTQRVCGACVAMTHPSGVATRCFCFVFCGFVLLPRAC